MLAAVERRIISETRGAYKALGTTAMVVLGAMIVVIAKYMGQSFPESVWAHGRVHFIWAGILSLSIAATALAASLWFLHQARRHTPKGVENRRRQLRWQLKGLTIFLGIIPGWCITVGALGEVKYFIPALRVALPHIVWGELTAIAIVLTVKFLLNHLCSSLQEITAEEEQRWAETLQRAKVLEDAKKPVEVRTFNLHD